jgi:hypothetical protein
LTLLWISGYSAVDAQTQHVQRVEIVNKGIYDNKNLRRATTQASPTGGTVVVGNIKNIEDTTKVPAIL